MNSKLIVRHRELTEEEIYAQVINLFCTDSNPALNYSITVFILIQR